MFIIAEQKTALKKRFGELWIARKKWKSLVNYSDAPGFKHHRFLGLIQACLRCSWVDDEDVKYLDHLLGRYKLDEDRWIDWTVRSHYTAGQLRALRDDKKIFEKEKAKNHSDSWAQQFVLGLDQKATAPIKPEPLPVHVPVTVLPSFFKIPGALPRTSSRVYETR